MGATIPAMQRVSQATADLSNEMDEFSQALADGGRAMGDFGTAVERWQDAYTGDPPGTYRNHVNGNWNMDALRPAIERARDEHVPPPEMESMNPKHCTHFDANEFGNCKHIHWCFRVFGIELQCQGVFKKDELPQEESRKLEVL